MIKICSILYKNSFEPSGYIYTLQMRMWPMMVHCAACYYCDLQFFYHDIPRFRHFALISNQARQKQVQMTVQIWQWLPKLFICTMYRPFKFCLSRQHTIQYHASPTSRQINLLSEMIIRFRGERRKIGHTYFVLMTMMTSLNGNIYPLCGESTGPRHRPVTRSCNVFFDLRLE